ncbi:hypothetical protein CR513_52015, partial [Mucuna pruriens]
MREDKEAWREDRGAQEVWKVATSAWAESRSICSSTIRTCPECTSGTSKLSTIDSTISGVTIPIIATIENASSRQFTISRGPDEAISNKQSGVSANYDL